VRNEAEEVLRDVADIISSSGNGCSGGSNSNSSGCRQHPPPVLIRINLSAEEAHISPEVLAVAPGSVSIQSGCLEALMAIDLLMQL
jgi:hypothetical protein